MKGFAAIRKQRSLVPPRGAMGSLPVSAARRSLPPARTHSLQPLRRSSIEEEEVTPREEEEPPTSRLWHSDAHSNTPQAATSTDQKHSVDDIPSVLFTVESAITEEQRCFRRYEEKCQALEDALGKKIANSLLQDVAKEPERFTKDERPIIQQLAHSIIKWQQKKEYREKLEKAALSSDPRSNRREILRLQTTVKDLKEVVDKQQTQINALEALCSHLMAALP